MPKAGLLVAVWVGLLLVGTSPPALARSASAVAAVAPSGLLYGTQVAGGSAAAPLLRKEGRPDGAADRADGGGEEAADRVGREAAAGRADDGVEEVARAGDEGEAAAGRADEGDEEAATASGDDVALYPPDLDADERDPLEEVNRTIFGFNRRVGEYVLDPISETYQLLIPDSARRAVHRAFRNLRSPSVFVNDVLQLEPRRASETGLRFVVNSTVGLAGLFDPAGNAGLPPHHADFGQTLGRAGVPSGPYLVLPVFGPSTARDAVGVFVDGLVQPQFYLLGAAETVVLGAGSGLSTLDANLESLEMLRETSVDFYAALRSSYLMQRHMEIHHPEQAVGGALAP